MVVLLWIDFLVDEFSTKQAFGGQLPQAAVSLEFFQGPSQSSILKKFLASKISPERYGYSDAFGLDIAA